MSNDNDLGLTILVVDDVAVHRFLMVSGLQRLSPTLTIEQAANIHDAMAMLQARKFDVVVSDWTMPAGGGDELIRWMRARPHFQRVPFVMISGKNENADIIDAFMKLGVDAYIVKPFLPEELLSKLMSALNKRRDIRD